MAVTKQITRSDERMRTETDWLNSRHSFPFGGHHDPERMGFGPLRVVNQDIVAPGRGFPAHPHRDMEIISIVLEGELEHRDSLGNGSVIQTGDIQYMSAGSGVVHSEFNPSGEVPVHFLQIWIEPRETGLKPRYADQPIIGAVENEWKLILSADGRGGSIEIRQDTELRTVQLAPGRSIDHAPDSMERGLWLFVIEGEVIAGDDYFTLGDSLAMTGEEKMTVANAGTTPARVLLFELPV